MRKIILSIIAFFAITINCFSQIIVDEVRNGIRGIYPTEEKKLKLSDGFDYRLVKLITPSGISQYYIQCSLGYLKYNNFPNNSKLLFKTFDNKVIELTSIISYLEPDINHCPFAYFPITQVQLESLFTGISKVRVEILSYDNREDKPFVDYPEKEYKKDEIGKNLRKMFTIIEQQSLNVSKDNNSETKKSLNRKDNSDF